MFVCVCKALRSKEITDLINSGAKTVEEISSSCGAGTDCGSCLRRLKSFVDAQTINEEELDQTLPLPSKAKVAG